MAIGRRIRPVRGRSAVVALAVAVGLLATACGQPDSQYIKTPDATAYSKIPIRWTTYDTGQMLPAVLALESQSEGSLSPTQVDNRQARNWITGFAADPRATPQSVAVLAAPVPVGFMRQVLLSTAERESMSLTTLKNRPIAIDQLSQDKPDVVNIVKQNEFFFPGGFHAFESIFTLKTKQGAFITGNQVSAVDPSSSVLYEFVVGCEASCYQHNLETINEIVQSWTVRPPS